MSQLLLNIDVYDLDAAERFYTQAFGLRIGRRLGSEAVELLGAEVPIYLLLKPAGSRAFPGASKPRDYVRHWTPVHFDFAVEDIDAAVERARTAGGHSEAPISQHAWGKMALFSDPFGHGFCLLQFHGAGYDEVATLETRSA